jgi:hypothetical protein
MAPMPNITLLPSAKVPLIYDGGNTMTTEWYRFFWNIYGFTGTGVVPVDKGGTGLDTIGNHQIIIGNVNNVFEPASFSSSSINISYPAGYVNLEIGTSTVTPGTYGSASQVGVFTVNQYGVLIAASNTSIAISASQITSGILSVPRGGTGAATLTGYVKGNGISAFTASTTVPTTDLSGTITNAQLANSTISGVALGGNLYNLTAGTGVSFSTGTTYNGSTAITINATGSGGTVTSVTGTAPIASSGGTTPAISISQATTSTNGYLSSTDWNTFNNKQPSGTYVTSVTGTAPVVSSGGTTPAISMAAATASVNGYLTSTDWTTFNNKGSGTVTSITSTTLTIGGTSAIPTVNLTSGIVTAGTTGSSTLIPVITVDTYGRVTNITTASNPQGTVTSVSGTGTVNGITLTGTVTSSGSLTLGGTLSGIGNSQLTNSTISGVALGSNLFSLTAGTGVSFSAGTTYNGSAAITINATGSGGTVTSVAATVPSFLSISGSPITTSGTLAISYSGTALPAVNGGTAQTAYTTGDILYASATNTLSKLAVGTTGYTLTVASGVPTWKPPYTRTSFTATGGQTSFTATYNVGYVQVFINGVLLNAADYTASSGTAVVLAVAANAGDILETIAYNV